jgi:MerR family mercuric resistance operon transcriptional regulator
MEKLSIGELARQANVNIETIRYYERRGLISEPPRNKSGHRQYSHEAVKRTDFIKKCQTLGFSLKEIEEILELRITRESTCADMKSRVTEKLMSWRGFAMLLTGCRKNAPAKARLEIVRY